MKHHRNRNLSNIMVFFALANSSILFSGLPVIQYMCYDHLVSVLSGFVIRFLMTINSLDDHLELSMAAVKICCRTCGRCLVSMQTNALPEGSFFTNLKQRREFNWMNVWMYECNTYKLKQLLKILQKSFQQCLPVCLVTKRANENGEGIYSCIWRQRLPKSLCGYAIPFQICIAEHNDKIVVCFLLGDPGNC